MFRVGSVVLALLAVGATGCGDTTETPAGKAAAASKSFEARVGEPLRYTDSLTINDIPNEVDADVTVRAVRVMDGLPEIERLTYPLRDGRVFVRAQVEVHSRAAKTLEFSATDFELIDSDGERVREEGADVFKPALMSARLVKGDKVRGYVAFQMSEASRPAEIRLASQVDPAGEPRRWAVR